MSKNKPTILVADDDSLLRDLLKVILRDGGYAIAGEARTSEAAAKLCIKLKPDLVLLDINMPDGSGLAALCEIRKDAPDTKVVMISAEATRERVAEAKALGATGFIVKPLTGGRVLDEVAAALAHVTFDK